MIRFLILKKEKYLNAINTYCGASSQGNGNNGYFCKKL